MIPSCEVNTLRVSHLQSNQKGYRLDRVIPSIDKVSHEEIVGEGQISSDSEKLNKIMQLTVDITTDGDRCLDGYGISLF